MRSLAKARMIQQEKRLDRKVLWLMAEIGEHLNPDDRERALDLLDDEAGKTNEHNYRWCRGCHAVRVRLDMIANPTGECRACRKGSTHG